MELKRNLSLAVYLSARQTYLQRKRTNLQTCRVCRKVINGRTDQWWQDMIGEDVPDWCWRKNFHMSKECFISFIPLKSLLFCSGRHLVSWKTKSLRMSKLTITGDFFRFSGPFGRAESPSLLWKTGLGFLAQAELRPESTGWLGWNSPCNQALKALPNNKKFSISDNMFSRANKTLNAYLKHLSSTGEIAGTVHKEPLSTEVIQKLYKKGELVEASTCGYLSLYISVNEAERTKLPWRSLFWGL